MKRLFISFSGGETSGYMFIHLLAKWKDSYDEIQVVFANTGQENEKTLQFVDNVAKYTGVAVVWVEAVVHHNTRKGCTHLITDFHSADRNGRVFEEVIKKYGIPNQMWKHCNRELKLNPMNSYMRSIGWDAGSYDTAIGIRVDEMDRMNNKKELNRFVYPFISDMPTTKQDVNTFWASMPFRLGLKGYEGNCKWCWKKTLRKHLTIITEHPEHYAFPERMEQTYGTAGAGIAEGIGCTPEGKRVFFRGNKSVEDIKRMASEGFEPALDDAVTYNADGLLSEIDQTNGCEESCEAFGGE